MLSQDSEDEIRSRLVFELAIWLWQDELNPRVRCAFGNVFKIVCKNRPCDPRTFPNNHENGMLESVCLSSAQRRDDTNALISFNFRQKLRHSPHRSAPYKDESFIDVTSSFCVMKLEIPSCLELFVNFKLSSAAVINWHLTWRISNYDAD